MLTSARAWNIALRLYHIVVGSLILTGAAVNLAMHPSVAYRTASIASITGLVGVALLVFEAIPTMSGPFCACYISTLCTHAGRGTLYIAVSALQLDFIHHPKLQRIAPVAMNNTAPPSGSVQRSSIVTNLMDGEAEPDQKLLLKKDLLCATCIALAVMGLLQLCVGLFTSMPVSRSMRPTRSPAADAATPTPMLTPTVETATAATGSVGTDPYGELEKGSGTSPTISVQRPPTRSEWMVSRTMRAAGYTERPHTAPAQSPAMRDVNDWPSGRSDRDSFDVLTTDKSPTGLGSGPGSPKTLRGRDRLISDTRVVPPPRFPLPASLEEIGTPLSPLTFHERVSCDLRRSRKERASDGPTCSAATTAVRQGERREFYQRGERASKGVSLLSLRSMHIPGVGEIELSSESEGGDVSDEERDGEGDRSEGNVELPGDGRRDEGPRLERLTTVSVDKGSAEEEKAG